jgi:hypothetical protein
VKKSFIVSLPNANGRVYPEDVLRKAVAKAQEKVKHRRMLGAIEPPADGKTRLAHVSHVVTDLKVDENGEVLADLEFLDTEAGKLVVDSLLVGVPMHVNMRALGTPNSRGVIEDLELLAVDIQSGLAPREPDVVDKLAKLVEEEDDGN